MRAMFALFRLTLGAIKRLFSSRKSLLLENLALRQQLAVLKRKSKRPRPNPLDRLFWIADQTLLDRLERLPAYRPLQLRLWAGTVRVSACTGSFCREQALLFLDGSKNKGRRWCDMKLCGNRIKARRYRGRQRAAVLQ